MTKSAVDHMEVRWRVTGTTQWSAPRSYPPAADVDVDGLERDKQYDFEVRNVSACGATSVWVPSNYTVPPAPVGTLTLVAMQQGIQDASSAAAAANAQLAAIASDNILSPAEKPTVMRNYSVITTEQAGIDAQAAQYGVSAQQSDYDNAISTLTAYLNGLNTPVPWNNKSGNTDIVGTSFSAYFKTVYTARQALLNAIYAQAKIFSDLALKPGQNLVPNPTFAVATPGGGYPGWAISGPGWTAGNKGLYGNHYFNTCAENVVSSAAPITSVLFTQRIPFPPNAVHSVRVTYAVDRSYSSGSATADIRYVDAAGNTLLDSSRIFTSSGSTGGIVTGQMEGAVSPANTAFIVLRLYTQSAAETGGAVYFRIGSVKVELGAKCTSFSDDATQYGNQLTNAGSGQKLGDQGNIPASLTSNLGMVRSATALTAFSTGAVNVNAHTVTYGPKVVSYNAKTNAVTGLAQGVGYYIYTRDNYQGGSPTWNATASAATANGYDDAYNAGYVTIPTSGSGGGGGAGGPGGGGCVCADMWLWPLFMGLRGALNAGDLARRWRWWKPWLWFLRGPEGWHLVRRRPRIVQEPCVRPIVADGSHLDCSVHTPVTTRTGESILAPHLFGHGMATCSGWQRVTDVIALAGLRDVVRICVGGNSFFASADGYRFISTHNVWKN